MLKAERWQEAGLHDRPIGAALALLKPREIALTVAHCDREIAQGKLHPQPQMAQQYAKFDELRWLNAWLTRHHGSLFRRLREKTPEL